MRRYRYFALLLLMLLLLGIPSFSPAAEFWLRAEKVDITLPDGVTVPMWGFALDEDHDFSTLTDGAATVPGPVLTVPPGDTVLTIHLYNKDLPEPVSLIIPGQTIVPSPERNPDGRVRSFTAEVAPGAEGTYTWSSPRTGTYLYQSGTHPAVQVQMGLYGALKKDAEAGRAYSGVPYLSDVILLYSEIDPALHNAVANDDYGPGKSRTSTLRYEPKYFLINGQPFSGSSAPLPAGRKGESTLLRFLNAGLQNRVPIVEGLYLTLRAEDGNVLPYPREQYSLLLPPGKTTDALIVPDTYGNYPLYDRRLALTNAASSPGGMLVYLSVSPPRSSMIGTFNNGVWRLDLNGNGVDDGSSGGDLSYTFGTAGDIPVTGDWNGDGKTKIGTFNNGVWRLDLNGNGVDDGSSGGDLSYTFGTAGDIPVTGDWNGDGKTKIGVYRAGSWYLDLNGNGVFESCSVDRCFTLGTALNTPVTGDWSGDGKAKIGIFRNGTWRLDLNGSGTISTGETFTFGASGSVPVTGDWSGDGKAKIGIFRNGTWRLDYNGNGVNDGQAGGDRRYTFGTSGDTPVTGKW